MITKTCEKCGKEYNPHWVNGNQRYCSLTCSAQAQKIPVECTCETCGEKYTRTPATAGRYCSKKCFHEARRDRVECSCGICGKSFHVKRCEIKRGHGKFCSKTCMGVAQRGENHWNWNDDGLPKARRIRNSMDYREWRETVFARDNWICQDCGANGKVHAHHIFSFAEFPEHQLEPWNGVTLCHSCHVKCHPRLAWLCA